MHLRLRDSSGVFLQVQPEAELEDSTEYLLEATENLPEIGREAIEALEQALSEATERNATLAAEVSSLREGVEREKKCVKDIGGSTVSS